jgi:tungstate transport system ATP-binding protein
MNIYSINNAECRLGAFNLSISDCAIEKGKIYSVLGPNGSGKSSFLNLLALLNPPRCGQIAFEGQNVRFGGKRALLPLRRRIAYLTQNPYLFNMTVIENIGYGLRVRGVPGANSLRQVENIMRRLDILHLAARNAHRLSGGEAQRVALARVLALDCQVLLLDEPTANVDRANVHALERTLLEICREKDTTVVMTTHSHDQAYRMSHELISIINGRIQAAAYENIFEGDVSRNPDGQLDISVAGGVKFFIGDGTPGMRVTISVATEDIVLSKARLESSALNSFCGMITKSELAPDGRQHIFIAAGGVALRSMITSKSFDGMGLGVGKEVWATFKASSVRIL